MPTKVLMQKIGITKGITYSNVEKDCDDWVDAKKTLPADFDLCFLKFKNKKTKTGWATGMKFDGLRVNSGDEVLYWKKSKDAKEGIYATAKR